MQQLASKMLIGISACLAGEAVRYDGGHKRQFLLMTVLGPHARLSPFCPEVAAGLGVPRPPVHLVETSGQRVRALGVADASLDVTEALEASATDYCRQQLEYLDGFVFKSRSPSCGLGSTPLYSHNSEALMDRDGLFAERVRQAAPCLPCVEESWLDSELHCWRFLAACCVHAYYRHHNLQFADLVDLLKSTLILEVGKRGSEFGYLIEALLTPTDDTRNAKTALWERLADYFTGEFC